jgi:hypothetical protein
LIPYLVRRIVTKRVRNTVRDYISLRLIPSLEVNDVMDITHCISRHCMRLYGFAVETMRLARLRVQVTLVSIQKRIDVITQKPYGILNNLCIRIEDFIFKFLSSHWAYNVIWLMIREYFNIVYLILHSLYFLEVF